MPPALSDSESEDQVEYPGGRVKSNSSGASDSGHIRHILDSPIGGPRNGIAKTEETEEGADEGDEGDEDEEDLEEDEYIVEAIKKHMIDAVDGTLKFQVKWEGYNSKSDLTWEPEENLAESASEILEAYLQRLGGRDKIFEESAAATKGKKRGRAVSGATMAKRSRRDGEAHPSKSTPPATAASKSWSPPAGSWEDEINKIDAFEEEGSGKLVVYLQWKNGLKTKHDTKTVYQKCPQKMLRFYESHVKIIKDDKKETKTVLR